MESVLNWVVVGIGDIATKRVIPAILAEPRSHLWGVVSRDPAKAAPYTERVWTSLEEALRDPAVEAVYVAAPVFLHAPLATAALRAGRHVLCEKPMAMNYPQALDMVATGQQAGQVLGVAYYRRMYPKLHRARLCLPRARSAVRCSPRSTATAGSPPRAERGTGCWTRSKPAPAPSTTSPRIASTS